MPEGLLGFCGQWTCFDGQAVTWHQPHHCCSGHWYYIGLAMKACSAGLSFPHALVHLPKETSVSWHKSSFCFWKVKVLHLVLEATFVAAKMPLDHSLSQLVSFHRPSAVHPQLSPEFAQKGSVRGCMLGWTKFWSMSLVFWNSSGKKSMTLVLCEE